ncbi:MAG: sigma-54 dependent transcriptional regulator [Polyangiales bacterium]
MSKGRVLLVDDDDDLRSLLSGILRGGGWSVEPCHDGHEALAKLAAGRYDCVVSDVRMPGLDGLSLLDRVRRAAPGTPMLLLTAHGELDDAVRAIGEGAAAYLPKPIGHAALLDAVARATLGRERVDAPPAAPVAEGLVVGRSPAMIELYGLVARAAKADVPVLITGETGSGKEWVARAIHRYSRRSAGPFVAINCAAMSTSTLESELFGHARGSFTGAAGARRGLLAAGDGGVVFLDEVGELGPRVQSELLRVLQSGELRPVGSDTVQRVDARVIAATHRDLDAMVAEGSFRADLLYRLRVIELRVPPLRERPEDVPALAEYFLRRVGSDRALSDEAVAALVARRWRGNVRELRAAVERAAAMCPGPVIHPEDLAPEVDAPEAPAAPAPEVSPQVDDLVDAALTDLAARAVVPLDALARAWVRVVLARHGGNKSHAAEALGIDRKTLRRMLRRADEPDDNAD